MVELLKVEFTNTNSKAYLTGIKTLLTMLEVCPTDDQWIDDPDTEGLVSVFVVLRAKAKSLQSRGIALEGIQSALSEKWITERQDGHHVEYRITRKGFQALMFYTIEEQKVLADRLKLLAYARCTE